LKAGGKVIRYFKDKYQQAEHLDTLDIQVKAVFQVTLDFLVVVFQAILGKAAIPVLMVFLASQVFQATLAVVFQVTLEDLVFQALMAFQVFQVILDIQEVVSQGILDFQDIQALLAQALLLKALWLQWLIYHQAVI
jgi:hypothetical protein